MAGGRISYCPNERAVGVSCSILNGFGRTLGDSIIGLQALSAAQTLGVIGARPTLFRLPGLPAMVQAAYAVAADMAEIATLPWDAATPDIPFAPADGFDRVIDMRDFAFDPAFRGVAMIDYFLGRLGLDPMTVASALRRNAWLAPRVSPVGPRGHVLLCPRTASDLRTMPEPVRVHIHAWLAEQTGAVVLDQAELPPVERFEELCGLVAGARLVLSADTAMVHLADAFAVPCLAFFTTHRPEWRVRDYPLCRPVYLPSGLPEAIEFVRDVADVAACHAAWFARGADLGWLDAVLVDAWKWANA